MFSISAEEQQEDFNSFEEKYGNNSLDEEGYLQEAQNFVTAVFDSGRNPNPETATAPVIDLDQEEQAELEKVATQLLREGAHDAVDVS